MRELIIEVPDNFGKTLKPEKVNSEIKGELIRCKECKHGEKVPTFKYYPDMTWCNKYLTSHNDDWFCADGKLKEGVHE